MIIYFAVSCDYCNLIDVAPEFALRAPCPRCLKGQLIGTRPLMYFAKDQEDGNRFLARINGNRIFVAADTGGVRE